MYTANVHYAPHNVVNDSYWLLIPLMRCKLQMNSFCQRNDALLNRYPRGCFYDYYNVNLLTCYLPMQPNNLWLLLCTRHIHQCNHHPNERRYLKLRIRFHLTGKENQYYLVDGSNLNRSLQEDFWTIQNIPHEGNRNISQDSISYVMIHYRSIKTSNLHGSGDKQSYIC